MILDATFPPDPRVENEAVSLIHQGHEVVLFCLTYRKDELKEEVYKGIQIKRYPTNQLEYKFSALTYSIPFYTWLMQRKIDKFINSFDIESIHIHDVRIAQSVFNVNKKYRLPVVLDLHENRPEIMKFYPHLSKFPGKYLISPKKWKEKEQEFVKQATKVVVVTAEAKRELLQRVSVNANQIIVVPNTVRKDFYSQPTLYTEISSLYLDNFVILYIGDTGLRRGLETAIRAMALLKDHIPKIKLVIVGKNTTDNVLKKLVVDLQIESYVDFLGWKDQRFFQTYITMSHVCISPLLANVHHHTTYANKIFQYMSLAKPLLVSDVLAQKNIVEKANSGAIHQEGNAKDFSEKIIELFNNNELREHLGNNGFKFVSSVFSWEQVSKPLLKLYDNLSI